MQYRSDAGGNLTNLIYPGNRVVAYSFDSLDRLDQRDGYGAIRWLERLSFARQQLALLSKAKSSN